MVHILIADDHALLRDGLKPFVSQVGTDVIIHEAGDFATAHSIIANKPIDLAMLDLRMPGMKGMAGAARLRQEFPDTCMAIISGWMTHEDALLGLQIGVMGYLPKSLSGSAMVHALRLIMAGEAYYPPSILVPDPKQTEAVSSLAPLTTSKPMGSVESGPQKHQNLQSLDVLTRREKEILTHLVEGASNRQIADKLGLTEITIKSHLRNVFRKIGASNRTQAVTFALNCGIKAASEQMGS